MPRAAGRHGRCPCCAHRTACSPRPGAEVDPTDPRTVAARRRPARHPGRSPRGASASPPSRSASRARRVQRRRHRAPQDAHLPRPVRPVQRRGRSSATRARARPRGLHVGAGLHRRREAGRDGSSSAASCRARASGSRSRPTRSRPSRAAARDRPHRGAAVPGPGRRPPRVSTRAGPIGSLTPVPVAQRQRQAT